MARRKHRSEGIAGFFRHSVWPPVLLVVASVAAASAWVPLRRWEPRSHGEVPAPPPTSAPADAQPRPGGGPPALTGATGQAAVPDAARAATEPPAAIPAPAPEPRAHRPPPADRSRRRPAARTEDRADRPTAGPGAGSDYAVRWSREKP